MGIRDAINRHPTLMIALSSGGIAAVLLVVFMRARPGSLPQQRVFYTTDEGATLFADDLEKMPPFDHDGKPAVRAFVFTCDDGKTQFVQYLEKYSDETKRRMEGGASRTQLGMGQIKKPGSGSWIQESSPKSAAIIAPPCPDAMAKGQYRQVLP